MKKHNTMLKSARMKKSWTPEFVSEKVGVSLNTYIRWETGAQLPRLSSLDALCKVFGMPPEELGFADLPIRKRNIAQMLTDQKEASSSPLDTSEPTAPAESLALWSLSPTSSWPLSTVGGPVESDR